MTPIDQLEYRWPVDEAKRRIPTQDELLVDDRRVIRFERIVTGKAIGGGDLTEARVFVVGDFTEQMSRRYVKHSPTGFEWGYGGSGPADTALNILALVIPVKEVTFRGLYQHFKQEFVARVPRDGGEIKMADVRRWLAEQYRNAAVLT